MFAPVISATPPPATTTPLSRRRAIAFCSILIGLPLLMVPVMLALGRSDFFLHHGASAWVQANDAIFSMHDRACDVLLFGDSTAMTGLDPSQIQQMTGLRTCDIAVTNAVLAVTDTLPLDHFLAHNAAPRVLLLQFSPDGFQPEAHTWTRSIYAEGLLELLRHGAPATVRSTLLHHPRETLAFTGYVAGYTAFHALRSMWTRFTGLPIEDDRIRIRNGFFTPPAAALAACSPPEHSTAATDRQFPRTFVSGIQQRYKQIGTVLVNIAPIPSCDEDLPAFTAQLTGAASSGPTGLPVQLFNDSRHFTAAGAQLVSAAAARQIQRALGPASSSVAKGR